MPEIVPKARGTSQHNLKSKTQFKLGFRVLFYVFLVVSFKNMQGIHSENKQQLNQTHITDKDAYISQRSNKKPVLRFTHNGQATPENTH